MFIFGILKKYLCLNWVYSNRKIHKKNHKKNLINIVQFIIHGF